jgi:hypothetical protein
MMPRWVMRNRGRPLIAYLSMLGALMLTGCAAQATHYHADINAADSTCKHAHPSHRAMIECFDSVERPVLIKDLPGLMTAYDDWQAARLLAAANFDRDVTEAAREPLAAWHEAEKPAATKLTLAINSTWTGSRKQSDALKQHAANAVTLGCKKDGQFVSTLWAESSRCERDIRLPLYESEIPAASNALHEYWEVYIRAGAAYDAAVQPALVKAAIDYKRALEPAKAAFRTRAQSALDDTAQADAYEAARVREDIMQLLAGLVQTTIAVAGAVAEVRAIQYCSTHVC